MKNKHYFSLILLLIPMISCCNVISYSYTPNNSLSSVDYGNGYTISYSYDSNGNLTNQLITQPDVTPLSPTQFNITSNGDLVTLGWEPVVSNVNGTPIIVTLYVIEASSDPTAGFTLIGTTNQTQYSISSYNYPQRFYRVRAAINYQRDPVQPDAQIDTITTDTRSNE
jgi:hypothetical protein